MKLMSILSEILRFLCSRQKCSCIDSIQEDQTLNIMSQIKFITHKPIPKPGFIDMFVFI